MTSCAPPPLAFGHRLARMERDPDALAEQIARAVPLRELAPLDAMQPFTHRAFGVRAGQLEITAAAHSPLRGANHAQDKAIFTLPFVGEKHFQINGRPYSTRAGHNALLLPGEAFTLDTNACSGVIFSVCPKAIAEAATTMAGGPERVPPLAPIQSPVELLELHPPQGNLLTALRRTLRLIDLLDGHPSQLPGRLGLDDKILRLIALLVHPRLLTPDPPVDQPLERREASAFADLISALRGDLQGEWTLSRMERRAGLSRTRLRRHFQAAFGCAPLEWLRVQRLCWAHQRLASEGDLSLPQLALDCGFATLEEFRTAFAERFQLQPDWRRVTA